MIGNPRTTLKDLTEQLQAEGYTPAASTIPTIRSDLLHTLRCLQEAGYARELEL
jgi:hypothetical protein